MDLSDATGAVVHCGGAVDFVLLGAAVPEPYLACTGAARGFLSHAVQHHCPDRMYPDDQGEFACIIQKGLDLDFKCSPHFVNRFDL